MIKIGLTGGIASGKSTVAAMLRERGAIVINADEIAHQVYEKGQDGWQRLVDLFGENILDGDREINRSKLGEIVFSDPEKLQQLNITLEDLIRKEIEKEIAAADAAGERFLVLDAPLLIEYGINHEMDEVWLVALSESEQIKRLLQRDGYDENKSRARLASQMSFRDKSAYADVVIDNNIPLEDLARTVDMLWDVRIRDLLYMEDHT